MECSLSLFMDLLNLLDYDGDPWNVGSMETSGGDPSEMLEVECEETEAGDKWKLKVSKWSNDLREWKFIRTEAEGPYKVVLVKMIELLPFVRYDLHGLSSGEIDI